MRTPGIIIASVVALAALKAAAVVVVPLLVAITIAVAFQPVAERLAARGLPPAVVSIVTMIGVLAVLAGIGALVVLAARDLVNAAPRYVADVSRARDEALVWLDAHDLAPLASSVRSLHAGTEVAGLVKRVVVLTSGVLGDLLNVLFLTVFMQLEAGLLRQKLAMLVPAQGPMERALDAIAEVQRYLRIKFVLSVANGVLLGGWCALWGVSNPLLWGVLAFALNFVPVIGSLIAAIPPVLLGVAELGWGGALGIVAGYVAVNLVVDNMIEPRLMGRTLRLSPLVLMISLLLWGFVLGPVGALLSVPLTVALRIYCDYHPGTRWIGLLLAAGTSGYRDLVKPAPAAT